MADYIRAGSDRLAQMLGTSVDAAKVMSLRLMDDDLMTKVFSGNLEATQFILRILMKNDSLKVLESHSQKNLSKELICLLKMVCIFYM